MLPVNSSVSVGTSTTTVYQVESNELPRTVFLTNDSANIIYVSIWNNAGQAAVTGKGIRLNANGGSVTIDLSPFEKDKGLYINAIASATSSLCFTILN